MELRRHRRRQDAAPGLQRRASRHRVAGARAGTGGPNQPQVCTPGAPGDAARVEPGRRRAVPEPRRRHREAAGPVRHLHPARHAPGRVQPELPRRGGAELGRLHGQRADRAEGRPVVEQLLEPDAADRRGALLDQRRRGQPAGQLRPRLEDGGAVLQERPMGRRLRPLQRALLDRDPDGVGVHLHRAAGVLLHRQARTPADLANGDGAAELPAGRCPTTG